MAYVMYLRYGSIVSVVIRLHRYKAVGRGLLQKRGPYKNDLASGFRLKSVAMDV